MRAAEKHAVSVTNDIIQPCTALSLSGAALGIHQQPCEIIHRDRKQGKRPKTFILRVCQGMQVCYTQQAMPLFNHFLIEGH